jgi:peptidoglycan hydrolase-like protein with peptidoglycan-binding domain
MSRIVAQFSCGAASAVATKLALAQHKDVQIINAFLMEEHEDNRRFAADCEEWFGQPIITLRDEKYGASTVQVFRRRQYMMGLFGAPCSRALKRDVLDGWKQPGDVMVFGYTAEEADRLDDFRDRNPDRPVLAPLIDAGLTKDDCKAMVLRAGIELPLMYRLGYDNANYIGCVKGGEGYWRAIREDFPEQFEANCLLQDEIGPGSWFLRYRSGPRKGERFPLRDLPAGEPRRNDALPSCSFFCEMAEQEYAA